MAENSRKRSGAFVAEDGAGAQPNQMRRGLLSIIGVGGLLAAVACSAPYSAGASGDKPATADSDVTGTDPADAAPIPTPKTPPAPTPGAKDGGGGGGGGGRGGGGGGGGGLDASAVNPAECPSKTTPTIRAWKAPPPASSVCSGADITYFASVAANQTWLGVESLMKTRNASCAKCIFSKETDSAWRPVVFVGTLGDARVNYGACFARATGGSDACGKGNDQWSDCYGKVCDWETCGGDAPQSTCYGAQGVADTCAAYNPTTTACGSVAQYNSLDNICGTYVEVARVLCSAGN